MSKSALGALLALLFVLLESGQFVYFGGLFQQIDSFLFGSMVFGLTLVFCICLTAIFQPQQIRYAFSEPRNLLIINIGAVATFTAFLLSVQLIEPAITYTISSGAMPISAYLLYRFGFRDSGGFRNIAEKLGTAIIFLSIVYLAFVTLNGTSGFVRSGSGLLGVLLAILDGFFFTVILLYSKRLNQSGIGPVAVLGLRLPLYVLVTGMIAVNIAQTRSAPPFHLLSLYVLIGFSLTVPPLYFLQRAVPLLSTLSISVITALGPLVIFALQRVEGRVSFSSTTILGLVIYFCGALIAAGGAFRAETISAPDT